MRCSSTTRCSAWCGATSPRSRPAGCIAATIRRPAASRALTRRLGLKTLINLRGQTGNGSDALSRDAAARLGLDFVDMALESRGAPQRDRILRLHAIYRAMRAPALLHCKSGADRAGLAAGLFVLFEGGTAREALRQLSLRFGHIRQARTGILDAFFLHYAARGRGAQALPRLGARGLR